MPAYLVTYDLYRPGQNYDGLIEELKKTAGWWHYMKSTWILSSSESPAQIWERLKPQVDTTDSVLIIQVCDNVSGWLEKDAWEWIHKHVPDCS